MYDEGFDLGNEDLAPIVEDDYGEDESVDFEDGLGADNNDDLIDNLGADDGSDFEGGLGADDNSDFVGGPGTDDNSDFVDGLGADDNLEANLNPIDSNYGWEPDPTEGITRNPFPPPVNTPPSEFTGGFVDAQHNIKNQLENRNPDEDEDS